MQLTTKQHITQMSILGLIMVIIIFALFNWQTAQIKSYITSLEAQKVGGMENYETLTKLYNSEGFKSAQKQQIEGAVSQMNGQQPSGETAVAATEKNEFPSGKLSQDQISKILAGTYVQGKEDAKITIVEYSDPECPFCIRHHNDKTIENVIAKYNGEVNHIVKPVQGVNHPGTEYKSLALLCAGKLGGNEAFYGMYDKIMGQSTSTQGGEVPVTKIPTFADELGLNTSNFKSCVDAKELLSTYSANWQEALTFKSGGTPGNMIINKETGEYKLIAGAYPVDAFTAIIDTWVK